MMFNTGQGWVEFQAMEERQYSFGEWLGVALPWIILLAACTIGTRIAQQKLRELPPPPRLLLPARP